VCAGRCVGSGEVCDATLTAGKNKKWELPDLDALHLLSH